MNFSGKGQHTGQNVFPPSNYFSKVVIPVLFGKCCRGKIERDHTATKFFAMNFIHIHRADIVNGVNAL